MKIALEDRILGLSILWKEAEYNFAYWDQLPDLDWDLAYRETLTRVIQTEDPVDYYNELKKFIALLRDGHTYVVMPEALRQPYVLPIDTGYFKGKHVLTMVPKESKQMLFSEIIAINDMPIEMYLNNYVLPYIWHEKLSSAFSGGQLSEMINNRESGVIKIETDKGTFKIEKGRETETIQIPYVTHPELEDAERLYVSETHEIYRTKDNLIYIDIPTFALDELGQEIYNNMHLMRDCRGVIVDIRGNNGGNSRNSDAVAQMFFEGEFKAGYSKTPVHIASFKAYGKFRNLEALNQNDEWEKKIYDVSKHQLYEVEDDEIFVDECPTVLTQPVVILSGAKTASAAECFLEAMKYEDRAIIIGDFSYGSNGQPYMGALPGGGWYGICTHRCYLPNGESYNNKGIKPDIFIQRSAEDMRSGFDSVFDKGLDVIRGRLYADIC